jgi:hypothetical protein
VEKHAREATSKPSFKVRNALLQKPVRKNLRFAMVSAKGSSEVDKTKLVVNAADTEEPPETKIKDMKTLTKLTLAVTMLLLAVSANAQSYYSGSSRDYAYRNPYAAIPSVGVHNYFRHDGTYVPSHFRTAPNWTTTDNLSYRGYGTIRVPRVQSGW